MPRWKLLLVATAMAFAFATAAQSKTVSVPGLEATWCSSSNENMYFIQEPTGACRENWITIYFDTMEIGGSGVISTHCTVTKRAIVGRDPRLVTPIYNITFKCHDPDRSNMKWNADMFVYHSTLYVTWKRKR